MRIFSLSLITFKLSTRTLVVIILLWTFYFEYITYWMLPFKWPKFPDCNKCKKLLLVSDPQIIGPEWKKLFFLDFIAVWDSDRYIKRTFLLAENYLKPDIIIFLGDLMDQGHKATESEYLLYFERLKRIFCFGYCSEKFIFLPGDNDIGGIEDILIPSHVKRFDKIFNQTEYCDVIEGIEFCKVNLITSTLQLSKIKGKDTIKIALSHVSLIPKENYFLKEVIKKIGPQLIFSGHAHKSYHFATHETDIKPYEKEELGPSSSAFKTYDLNEGMINEIMVPTCSYRMGVPNMGYGVAFVDTAEKLVHYNVLWLPQRYGQLYFELIMALLLIFLYLKWMFIRLRRIYLK